MNHLQSTIDTLKDTIAGNYFTACGEWIDEREDCLEMVFIEHVESAHLDEYHCYLMFDFATLSFKGSFAYWTPVDGVPIYVRSATFDDLNELYLLEQVYKFSKEGLEALKRKVFLFVRKVLFDDSEIGNISEAVVIASLKKFGLDDFSLYNYSGDYLDLETQIIVSGNMSEPDCHTVNIHATVNIDEGESYMTLGENHGGGFDDKVTVKAGLDAALEKVQDAKFKAWVLANKDKVNSMVESAKQVLDVYPWSVFVSIESGLTIDGAGVDMNDEDMNNKDMNAIDRNKLASELFVALIANPERYKYIAEKVDSGQLDNDAATAKNINKAYKLADQFIAHAERE